MNNMINERDKEFATEFSRFVNGKWVLHLSWVPSLPMTTAFL